MPQAQPTMLLTGASRGIGHATVKLFQERGWRILTVSRHPFSEECRWPSARESHLQADLADLDRLDALAAEVRRRLPTGELATVEQVADAVRYLACDASGSVTGTVLWVDGGWTAW